MGNTDNRYKIEGSGATTKEADVALEKERSKLIKRLGDEKAPTTLNVDETEYIGEYQVQESKKNDHSLQHFTIKDKKGWMVLNVKAARIADLSDYDDKYNIQEFIDLTAKQKEALNPSRKTKPAGYEAKSSSIDGFINNLR